MAVELDLGRVVCRLSELEGGARGFSIRGGDWPLRIVVVRVADTVRGYLNRCPHAGHPLDLREQTPGPLGRRRHAERLGEGDFQSPPSAC